MYVVSMGSQSGNGRPNLGSVKAAITIHFISSTLLLSSLLLCSYFSSLLSSASLSSSLNTPLVHHLSSSFNSLLFFTLHLLSPYFHFLYSALLSSTLTSSTFFLLDFSSLQNNPNMHYLLLNFNLLYSETLTQQYTKMHEPAYTETHGTPGSHYSISKLNIL